MSTYTATVDASVEDVWSLLARPGRWSEWAPHLRGAWGLGTPEVRPGARGAVRLLGVVPVPATITAKQPGRSWTWRVGPAELVHRVEPHGEGALVAIDLHAPGPLEGLLAASYGPVIALLVRNLARVAESAGRRY